MDAWGKQEIYTKLCFENVKERKILLNITVELLAFFHIWWGASYSDWGASMFYSVIAAECSDSILK
jgi:hypothetical protein